MIVQVLIDEDSPVMPLGMESAALLDVYRNQSCYGQYYHGDKTSQLAHQDREHDKSDERQSDGSGGIAKEPASDSHKLQGTLQPLENREVIIVVLHIFLLNNKGNALPSHG